MDHVRQDLRYALRSLARSPAYACVAIASLALGIAGNAVLFTFANGLLFKPLPVGEPDRVAALYTSDFSGTRYGASSYPDLVSLRAWASRWPWGRASARTRSVPARTPTRWC
jgi:hypothetical protein